MTNPVRDQALNVPEDRAERILAIAAGLAAAGVAADTNGNHLTGLDVTATACPPGRTRTEIMLDEDGYAEIRWYTNPAAPAAEIIAALARVLAAVTSEPAILAPAPPPGDDSGSLAQTAAR
jgi:hypothetical protein